MTRALSLEDFGDGSTPAAIAASPSAAPDTPPAATEDDRLAAFEQGYKSGWEDCVTAETEEKRRIASDLAAGLRDLSITHDAARREVLASLGPLFEEIAAALLPRLAAEALAPVVLDELRSIAEEATAPDVQLLAAPAACPALEKLVEAEIGLDLGIRPEPAFAEGQVSIRFGAERRDIDLGDAAARMAEAIRAFTAEMTRVPDPIQEGVA